VAFRAVGIKLLADVSGYMAGMGRAAAVTKEFSGELNKASAGGKVEQLSRATTGLGLGLVGAAAGAVKMSMDFDKAMSAAAAATKNSTKSAKENALAVEQLRQAALQAGKDTQFSATEAAQGITELGKAGVSTTDILGGGLKGALSLAAAGQISVGEAAQTAASALTQFKLQGSQLPHVADLLAAGAGKAQGSVHDMGQALNQSGLVASQFGLSIEDTAGALAEFAKAGLTGSDAGTSFKTMLLAIANPTQQTKNMMNDLGISFYDAQGKFIGISGVAQVLQTRLKGLTDAQRQQALGQLFGNDAIRAASVLYTDGAEGVRKWNREVNDQGYATRTAATLTDNLAGDLERLKSTIETLAISSGSGANGGLRVLVKAVNGLVNAFSDLPPFIGSTITVLGAVGGAALLLGTGWVKLRRSTAEVRAELEAMGPAGASAAAGMGKLSAAAGKVGLVFAALQVAGEVIGHFQKDLNPQIDALAVGLQKYAQSGQTAGETARVLGNDLGDLKKTFDLVADSGTKSAWARNIQGGLESIVPGLKGANDSLAQTKERIGSVDAALAQMVSSGNAAGANQAFQALASQLATGKVSMEEFRRQFPQYAAAVETAGSATGGTADKLGDLNSALEVGADGQRKYKTAADAAAGAARGEREAIGSLFATLKAETDPVFALIDAQKRLRDAQKAYTKAVKEHGRDSAEARAADLDLAKTALGLQGAVGDLSSTFRGKLDPAFVATLKAAGLTKKQIADVTAQFDAAKKSADKYDGKYAANVSAPGAKESKKQLDIAYTAANNYAGPYKANVSVTGYPEALGKLNRLSVYQQALKSGKIPAGFNGPIKGADGKYYAAGGWTGPGAKYQEAGVVHADEHVIQKESRQSLEAARPGGLDYMNATGKWPGYAGGGYVWPFPTTASRTRIPPQSEVAGVVAGNFGHWPSSPGAQRGDSGVWHKIVALVNASGIPHHFGNAYRPGDPLWHGSGRAVDYMGYNQDRLAQFFLARQSQVLELIHRTKSRDYGITRGHYNAMPHQWPLHRNHLHIAMRDGGTITEPVFGVGASGRTYSFGENYMPERVTPGAGGNAGSISLTVVNQGVIGSKAEAENFLIGAIDNLKRRGRL
jgi:TP901 family phage tail tape measure protein